MEKGSAPVLPACATVTKGLCMVHGKARAHLHNERLNPPSSVCTDLSYRKTLIYTFIYCLLFMNIYYKQKYFKQRRWRRRLGTGIREVLLIATTPSYILVNQSKWDFKAFTKHRNRRANYQVPKIFPIVCLVEILVSHLTFPSQRR